VRVIVADDSILLREGVIRVLEQSGFQVVGRAADADELMQMARVHRPDVAIIDIRMPPTYSDEGLRAALQIREELAGTGVLVLSQYLEDDYVTELLGDDAAGVGYLLKDRVYDFEHFTDAVRRVAEGGSALDPQVVTHMLGRHRANNPLNGLSSREREVLALMAQGRSNRAVADALVITERAVEKHVTSIFTRLDLPPAMENHRRVLAVLAFLRG
jgi:DNA-binding NarL/FixJ family response regulator